MSFQFDTTLRNLWLDDIETVGGVSPLLYVRTGSPPTNCAAVDTGTLLCTITLPSDWMAAAASGSKSKLGTWSATTAVTGTPGHFRFKTSGGTCFWQGTATEEDGGGDMEIDVVPIIGGRSFTVTTCTVTAPGA